MSEELKVPVSTTVKYADGTETTIHYNTLGEVEVVPEVSPETVSTSEEVAEMGETTGTEIEVEEAPAESIEETA